VRTRSPATLFACLLAAGLLAGCTGGEDSSAAPSSSSASRSTGGATTAPVESSGGGTGTGDTAGDGTSPAPPVPANTEPDTQTQSADARATVTEIRLGRHDGFDRVVFEVGGTGTPGWEVRYVDEASSQGSGAPIAVDGDAILQVTLTGMGYPQDTGVDEWSGPDPLSSGATEVVTEVAFDGTFEGTTVAFVGTGDRVPFRVYSLSGPTRVVLEVADPT
jgi:hypothetical protein